MLAQKYKMWRLKLQNGPNSSWILIYGFLGRLLVDGRGFLHQKPILKKRSLEQKSRCHTDAQKRVTVPLNRIENRRPAIINFGYVWLKRQLCLWKRLPYIDIYFYLGWFWGSKCNENCKRKFCSMRTLFINVTLRYNLSHIIVVINCSLSKKAFCKTHCNCICRSMSLKVG